MIKKRRSSAKAALGQQEAAVKRRAYGKRFVGDDTGAERGRAAERAKVLQMQAAARAATQRPRGGGEGEGEGEAAAADVLSRPWWEAIGGLAVESFRLATTVAWLPVRIAKLPLRVAASFLPRLRAV
jgi:hypothetical protein